VAEVTLEDVTKVYADGTPAVSDLDLDVADGEFMVLVGPSGSGKTTALRMVAGLEDITDGEVRIGDRVVNRVPPKDRDIAMVFQSYALYPHLTVEDNLGFSLKLHKVPRAERKRRVLEVARILGLEEFLDRKPRNLSGGQRQRVAMGRAIVRQPAVFLMDEPLSNLDAKLRVQVRAEIARIQRALETTTIYVTHDQTEAMTMGDRVAVLKRGMLQQVDTPQVLYDSPINLFVGGFIGSPAMNLVEAELREEAGRLWAVFGSQRLHAPDEVLAARPSLRERIGSRLVLGIRPESFTDAAEQTDKPDDERIRANVELVERLGSEVYVHFTIDAKPVLTEDTRDLLRERAELSDTTLQQHAEATTTDGVARLSPRTRVREGEQAELVVDITRLYFFDLETGLAVDGSANGDTSDTRVVRGPSRGNEAGEGNVPARDQKEEPHETDV
jgi:multiple sugar transport system ATP-binding protein